MKLFKKMLAEAFGTFVLVFCACGVAACTGGSLVATALTFGLVIIAMAHSIGRVSGCHINPAVSLGCLLTKRMKFGEFLAYVFSQLVGGFVGACAIFGFAKLTGLTLPGNACNGVFGTEGSVVVALAVEAILTAIFVYVILNVTENGNPDGNKAGIVIGLTLTLVHLIGINLTGTSVNPARSIATALGDMIFNGGTTAIGQVWIFVVGPYVGAIIAALLYRVINVSKKEAKKAPAKKSGKKAPAKKAKSR